MPSEVENPLSSLLKDNLGMISTKGKLTLKANDSLFTVFRKTANYIGKNGDWTGEDYIEATETIASLHEDQFGHVTSSRVLSDDEKAAVPINTIQGKEADHFIVVAHQVDSETVGQVNVHGYRQRTSSSVDISDMPYYSLVDLNNKAWKNQGNYYLSSSAGPEPQVMYTISNATHTIGYGKLIQNLRKDYDLNPAIQEVLSKENFDQFLARMTTHDGPKYGSWMDYLNPTHIGQISPQLMNEIAREPQENELSPSLKDDLAKPENYYLIDLDKTQGKVPNELVEWLKDRDPEDQPGNHFNGALVSKHAYEHGRRNYEINQLVVGNLAQTYDYILQNQLNLENEKALHAKSWQEKKHINKATQAVMDQTILKQDFHHVEIDNEVSLAVFNQFEGEAHRLMQVLPKPTDDLTLRLRKLGNHNALGAFYPTQAQITNTLVLDFRKMGEVGKQSLAADQDELGVSSFIHEYGHYLDYNLKPEGKVQLSLQDKFQPILRNYQRNLERLNIRKAEYYSTPTEVFARGFEEWVHYNQIKSNLITDPEYLDMTTGRPEYQAFAGNEAELYAYYDQIPELQQFKELNQGKDFSIDPEQVKINAIPKPIEPPTEMDLTDSHQLAAYSQQLLNEYTHDPKKYAQLLQATGPSIYEENCNRVLAVASTGDGRSLSQLDLVKQEFPIDKYRDQLTSFQAFEPNLAGRWESQPHYSYQQLKSVTKDSNELLKIADAYRDKVKMQRTLHQTKLSQQAELKDLYPDPITKELAHQMVDSFSQQGPLKDHPAVMSDFIQEASRKLTGEQRQTLYLQTANQGRNKAIKERQLSLSQPVIEQPQVAANQLPPLVKPRSHVR